MHPDQQGTIAAPQYSADGKWWWNGQEWVALPAPPLAPGSGTADPRSRGLAIASLTLSIVWLVGPGSVLAIVFGHLSRRRDRKAGAPPNGLALAGLVIGYVGAGLTVLLVLLAVAIPVFLSQREKNNDVALEAALRSAATAQETWALDAGTYTTSMGDLVTVGYLFDSLPVDIRIVLADSRSYCLEAASPSFDNVLYYSAPDGTISSLPCG